jgi:hypothetical protein
MHNWAAIVHGRTYEVDFRSNLIVVPEDFGREEIDWARRYILGTTVSPDELRHHPRWSVFKSDRHCVVGVTCQSRLVSEDLTLDIDNRPGYVFLGYVARGPFPPLPPREIEQFERLYQFVRDRWREKKSQSQDIHDCGYIFEPGVEEFPVAELPALNASGERIAIWPSRDERRLWAAASNHPGPISLCLGLAGSRDAVEGPFDNATTGDAVERILLAKPLRDEPPAARRPEAAKRKEPVDEGDEPSSSLGDLGRFLWNAPRALLHSARRAIEEFGEEGERPPRPRRQAPPRRETDRARKAAPAPPADPPPDPMAGFKFAGDEQGPGEERADDSEATIAWQRPPPCEDDGETLAGNRQNAAPPGFKFHDSGGAALQEKTKMTDFMDAYDPGMMLLDANGDGIADAAVVTTEQSTAVIETIDLDGDFQPDAALVSEDLNNDGWVDLVYEVVPVYPEPEPYGLPIENDAGLEHFDPAGQDADVIGAPGEEMNNWHQQANPDTCAVVSQEFILESLTGQEFSEEQLQYEAWRMGAYTPGGGTPLECMGDLLEAHGIPVEREYGATLDELSAKLADGEKVMVALDSHEIWTPGQDYVTDELLTDCAGLPGQQADHAVEVIGIDYSDPNNPMVVLNDPGHQQGRGLMVPADEFVNAWQDSNCYMVSTV